MVRQRRSLLSEIGSIHQDMELLFYELCKPPQPCGPIATGKWRPYADVYQAEETLVIQLELAGVRREDISILGEGQQLTIRGVRHDRALSPGVAYRQMEINYGEFERVFWLPLPVQEAEISARYEEGFLTVRIAAKPPPVQEGPRRIEITRS